MENDNHTELDESIVQIIAKTLTFRRILVITDQWNEFIEKYLIMVCRFALTGINDEETRGRYLDAAKQECEARAISQGKKGRNEVDTSGADLGSPINELFI